MKHLRRIGTAVLLCSALTLAACTSKAKDTENTSDTGSMTVPGTEDKKADKEKEFATMMASFNKLDETTTSYTVKESDTGLQKIDILAKKTSMSNTNPINYTYTYSYDPGKAYYENVYEQEGTEIKTHSDLFIKESDGEYKYYNGSKNTKAKLSDGHIDHESKFTSEDYVERFGLLDSSDNYFSSFDEMSHFLESEMDSAVPYLSKNFSSLFAMPEFSKTTTKSIITFGTNEGKHYAYIKGYEIFTMDAATTATSTLCAVTESECTIEFDDILYYDENSFSGCERNICVTLTGGDGTNYFNAEYESGGVCIFSSEFDSEDMPAKADSYEDATVYGLLRIETPEGYSLNWNSTNDGTDITLSDVLATYSGVDYGKIYLDKEMTQEAPETIKGKTYSQTFYASPKAKDENKVLVTSEFRGRKTTDESYSSSYGGGAGTWWKVYDIDENGQVSFKTWTDPDGNVFIVDSIEILYTNDTNASILDTSTMHLNVKHDKYYKIYMKGTLA